jgi:hypothetical protein
MLQYLYLVDVEVVCDRMVVLMQQSVIEGSTDELHSNVFFMVAGAFSFAFFSGHPPPSVEAKF